MYLFTRLSSLRGKSWFSKSCSSSSETSEPLVIGLDLPDASTSGFDGSGEVPADAHCPTIGKALAAAMDKVSEVRVMLKLFKERDKHKLRIQGYTNVDLKILNMNWYENFSKKFLK